jgi:hypothetical protein
VTSRRAGAVPRVAGVVAAVLVAVVAGTAGASAAWAQRVGAPAPAATQRDGRHETVLPEVRVDAFAGRSVGAQLGAGVALDAGFYTRLALLVAGGVERRPGGALVGAQRAEAVLRFHTDPLRKSSPGVYLGGGLGVRRGGSGPTRGVLLAGGGLVGAYGHHLAPAVELGVGGGARLGVALRRARIDER